MTFPEAPLDPAASDPRTCYVPSERLRRAPALDVRPCRRRSLDRGESHEAKYGDVCAGPRRVAWRLVLVAARWAPPGRRARRAHADADGARGPRAPRACRRGPGAARPGRGGLSGGGSTPACPARRARLRPGAQLGPAGQTRQTAFIFDV